MTGDYGADAESRWLPETWDAIRRRWWLVLGLAVAGFIFAVVYLRGATYTYTAELRVYAEPRGASALPGSAALGGLASLAGIGAGETASPFQLYLEGIRAREVAGRLARDRNLMRQVFAAEWDPRRRAWREPRPTTLGGLKAGVWGLLGLPDARWHAPDAARLQGFIAGNVQVIQSVRSPLVTIAMDHPEPKFAARFLTRLGATVDEYLREQSQARTRSNIAYLSDKLRGVTFAEQRAALFAALSDEERQAMLANSRAPYAASSFGVATVSLDPTKPRQVPLLVAGPIVGAIAGLVLAVLLGARRGVPDTQGG